MQVVARVNDAPITSDRLDVALRRLIPFESFHRNVGADTVERLEVVKSPTPDMDGDSIGGAVNMVSKTGFDTQGRMVRVSLGLRPVA